jgi:hypothetical protein
MNMVNNSTLRTKLVESTQGMWGNLNPLNGSIAVAFGRVKAPSIGSSVYYDCEAFYANTNVNVGDTYTYKYNQFKNEVKPRRFQRFSAGVKITEEQAELDNGSLKAMVETAALKQTRGLNTKLEEYACGYLTERYLVATMNAQTEASSSIIDPADCNAVPGTKLNAQAVKWTGPAQTERCIDSTVGMGIRGIGAKVLDTTTGESILHNDGTDTFDFWCSPYYAAILNTGHELMDTGEHDPLTYTQRLKESWNTTVRPSIQIENTAITAGATIDAVLTANTKENFLLVEVEAPHWLSWEKVDDGERIVVVKRYKAGWGAIARPYLGTTYAYKAQFNIDSIPYAEA